MGRRIIFVFICLVFVACSGEKAVVIEVKSTAQTEWVVGGRTPSPSSKPWAFVHIPTEPTASPIYFIVLQSELHEILAPIDAEYNRKFKEKHGVEYGDRPGVVNFSVKQAEPFKNAWEKILDQLST